MNVKIWDGKYAIRSDKNQYRLVELKQKNEDGSTSDAESSEDGVSVGYYPTLRYLLKSLAEMEGRQNRCTTMEGYVKHIEKINARLEEILTTIQSALGAEESLERIVDTLGNKLPEGVAQIGEAIEKPKRRRKKKG